MISLDSQFRRDIADAASPLAYTVQRFWTLDQPAPWDKIASGETVGHAPVIANHGHWQAHCPMYGCAGAALASPSDRRFVCFACGAGPFAADWPDDLEHVTELLDARPPMHRNTHTGQPIEDLEAETYHWLLFRAMAGV